MALTKVSGHIIDQPFDVGIITATNQYVSGIGTFGNIRVLGDLQIDGTTTTLDTVVTEVDRLEVGANNSTVGVAITQTGTGDILNLYDGSTEVFSVIDGGDVSIIDKIVHTGDTNTAIRFPAADTVTVETGGSERFRITSDGKVGIGLTNPGEKLSVNGGIEARGGGWIIARSGNNSGYAYIKNPEASGSQLAFLTSDTERLRITSAGKVGIGTDNPSDLLDVFKKSSTAYDATADDAQRDASASITVRNDDGTTNSFSQLVFDTAGSNQSIARIVAIRSGSGSNDLTFVTEHSNTKAERLRITSAGNIGIGTDVPAELLHLNGATNKSLLRFTSGSYGTASTDGSHVGINFGGLELWHKENNYLRFGTNNTERLRITSDGN